MLNLPLANDIGNTNVVKSVVCRGDYFKLFRHTSFNIDYYKNFQRFEKYVSERIKIEIFVENYTLLKCKNFRFSLFTMFTMHYIHKHLTKIFLNVGRHTDLVYKKYSKV